MQRTSLRCEQHDNGLRCAVVGAGAPHRMGCNAMTVLVVCAAGDNAASALPCAATLVLANCQRNARACKRERHDDGLGAGADTTAETHQSNERAVLVCCARGAERTCAVARGDDIKDGALAVRHELGGVDGWDSSTCSSDASRPMFG